MSSKWLFQDLRWPESFFYFLFLAQRYKGVKKILKQRQENLKPCWSVKKISKPTRASKPFAGLLQYKPRVTFCECQEYLKPWRLKMTWKFFLFFVSSAALQRRQENFEACWSVKKIWSPAGASSKFWSQLERQELLQDFYSVNQNLHFVILNVISSKWLFQDLRWHKSFLFFVSSAALQKRQELHFESIKKVLLQNFYSINQDLHFVILNVISSKWLFSRH